MQRIWQCIASVTSMPSGVQMHEIIIASSIADALYSNLALSLFSVQIIFST